MSQIIVTGANGQLGGLAIRHLLELGVQAGSITGVVRDEVKGAPLKELGIQTVVADYDDAESLAKAFSGASKLLFVSAPSMDNTLRIRQHANVVEAARNAGVKHIAYTSIASAEKMKLGLENVHLATEYMIKTTNIPYTFLRNAFYLEILVNESLHGIVAQGEMITSAPNGRMNFATRNDLALAAAKVLIGSGHDNKTYELVNPQPFTFNDFAGLVSEVSGKPVKHNAVSPAEAVQSMIEAGVPDGMAGFMVHGVYAAIGDGQFGAASEDLVRLIGDKFTTLQEAVRQVLK